MLLIVSCVPTTTNEVDDQFFQDVGNADDNNQIATTNNAPLPTATVLSAYPDPNSSEATQPAYPVPAPSVVAQSAYVAPPEPTPTWWPTPYPSPVRVQQPTPTAIPARQPSTNAFGTLYYATVDDEVPSTLFVAPVINDDALERNEDQSLLELSDSTHFVRLYPSPTNDMLAIIESGWGDAVTILDLEQNYVVPIYNNLDNQMPYLWNFHGWHPNGRYFLISDSNGYLGLWIVDGIGLEKPIKLTEHDPDSASMSPTSQMLAYAYRDGLTKKSLLMLAWSDGSHAQLLSESSSSTPFSELSWSPNGVSLAYVRGGYEIWVYNNGKHVRLFGGYKAHAGYSWSSDSRFIAYTARTGEDTQLPAEIDRTSVDTLEYVYRDRELRIYDVENATVYVPDPQNTFGSSMPSWSPDGRFVIFTAIQDGRLEIIKVAVDNFE